MNLDFCFFISNDLVFEEAGRFSLYVRVNETRDEGFGEEPCREIALKSYFL